MIITQITIKHIQRNKGTRLALAQYQPGLCTVFLLSLLLLENLLHDKNQSPYQKGRALKPSGNKLSVFPLYLIWKYGRTEQYDLLVCLGFFILAASVFVKQICVYPLFVAFVFLFFTVVSVSFQSNKK